MLVILAETIVRLGRRLSPGFSDEVGTSSLSPPVSLDSCVADLNEAASKLLASYVLADMTRDFKF